MRESGHPRCANSIFSFYILLQAVLLYYVGNVCMLDGRLCAVLADGSYVDVENLFLRSLEAVDPPGGHAFLLLVQTVLHQNNPSNEAASHSSAAESGQMAASVSRRFGFHPLCRISPNGNLLLISHQMSYSPVQQEDHSPDIDRFLCRAQHSTDMLVYAMGVLDTFHLQPACRLESGMLSCTAHSAEGQASALCQGPYVQRSLSALLLQLRNPEYLR